MENRNGLIMGWIRKALKEIFIVLKETYSGWLEARGTLLAAGLSYYAIFSLTPMLVIAITIADLVFDENLAVQRLIQFIEYMAGR